MSGDRESGEGGHGHLSDPGKESRAKLGIPVVPVFDGYRALAIFGVVLLHLSGAAGFDPAPGGPGASGLIWAIWGRAVEVLFIISGFVVFLPTVARVGRFGSVAGYAIRRAARLLPAYWLILLIIALLTSTIDFGSIADPPQLWNIGLHFVGMQVPASLFVPGIPMGLGLDPPLWTLSVEIGFYIVLPFIAYRYFRRPVLGLVIALLIATAWKLGFEHALQVADLTGLPLGSEEAVRVNLAAKLQFPAWAYSFGLGMTGAWAYVLLHRARMTETLRKRINAVLVLAGAGLVVSVMLIGTEPIDSPRYLLVSTLYSTSIATAMVGIALGPQILRLPFANGPIRSLGDISYGVYLCHIPIIFLVSLKLTPSTDGSLGALMVWALAVVPAAILYGYLSARFLEQPVRRWARKFGRREQTETPSGP